MRPASPAAFTPTPSASVLRVAHAPQLAAPLPRKPLRARGVARRARIVGTGASSSGNDNEAQQMREEQAELASIDRLASGWIGSSISRWEWYERIKQRRLRLRAHVKRREVEVSSQMDELRTVLLTLDALLGVGLVEKDDERISVLGWVVVLAVNFGSFVVAYIVFELFSNVFFGVFNAAPF